MTGPIVFISHLRVRAGMVDALRSAFAEVSAEIEADRPGTVVYLAFASEDATEVRIVHVFPDASAMDRHMIGVAERSARAREYMETTAFEVFGQPSAGVAEIMQQAAGGGVSVTHMPDPIGGYLRAGPYR
jgi:quinol monooxygenase YgiN